MTQCFLWDVVIIDLNVAFDGIGQLEGRIEAGGGNIAGGLFKNLSLGTLGNSIAGIIGGGLGGQLLGMLGIGGAEAAGSLDLTGILTTVAGGGGGVLLAVVGLFKKLFSK